MIDRNKRPDCEVGDQLRIVKAPPAPWPDQPVGMVATVAKTDEDRIWVNLEIGETLWWRKDDNNLAELEVIPAISIETILNTKQELFKLLQGQT